MRILLIHPGKNSSRLQALAEGLVQFGHQVHILGQKSNNTHLEALFGVTTHNLVFGYLSSLYYVWRLQPAVTHWHSWKSGFYVSLAAFLSPETTNIWTINTLPKKRNLLFRFLIWQSKYGFEAITTPSRRIQYELLTTYGLPTIYVPDGFTVPILPPIPSLHWKLRSEHYLYTTATKVEDLMRLGSYYKEIRSRRKILFAADSNTSYTYLRRKYPFFKAIPHLYSRSLYSIAEQARAVLVVGKKTSPELILHAMNSGRQIIAENYPAFEEIVGTHAVFIDPADTKEWVKTLRTLQLESNPWKEKALAGSLRASIHFAWDKIIPQYLNCYYTRLLRPVMVDSAQKRPLLQTE